jgi:uncharacterized membrane protein
MFDCAIPLRINKIKNALFWHIIFYMFAMNHPCRNLKYKFSRKQIFQVNDTLEIFLLLLNKKPDVNKMKKYNNNTALNLGKEKN